MFVVRSMPVHNEITLRGNGFLSKLSQSTSLIETAYKLGLLLRSTRIHMHLIKVQHIFVGQNHLSGLKF